MFTATQQSFINRPVEEVFDFIADPTNDPRWCPPVLEAEQIEGDGPSAGARYRQRVKPGPIPMTSTLELTEVRRNKFVAWQGSNGMATFHGRYEIEAVDDGTRVTMSSSLQPKGLARLLEPVLRRSSQDVAQEEFEILKQLLEDSVAPAPAGNSAARSR
jgi:carbon monoxide dehydrogenase subunit G